MGTGGTEPAGRERGGTSTRADARCGRGALVLLLLAPVVAEVLIGDLPFTATGLVGFVFGVPLYGGGAVLIRELVRRRGLGWWSVLLLGAAYGLVEEGLALRAMFDPAIYDGVPASLGGRVLGINGVYLLLQVVNHAVWSVTVPILLTERAFPRCRTRPFLGLPGLVTAAVLFLLGVGLTAVGARTTLSPGYALPPVLLAATLAGIAALVVAALVGRPRQGAVPAATGPVPGPWRVGVLAGVGSAGFLAVLVLPGKLAPSVVAGPFVVLPVLVALAVVGGLGRFVHRVSRSAAWTRTHTFAVGAGALLGHSLLWGITQPKTPVDHAVVAVLFVLTAAALALLQRSRPVDDPGNDAVAGLDADSGATSGATSGADSGADSGGHRTTPPRDALLRER